MKKLLAIILALSLLMLSSGFLTRPVIAAAETTNLNDVAKSITLMGAEQQNGAYKIEPNKDYEFDLEFAENESTQLANEKTLVYKVPKEMKVTQD